MVYIRICTFITQENSAITEIFLEYRLINSKNKKNLDIKIDGKK